MKEIRKKISEQTQKSLQKFVDDNPDFKKNKNTKRTNYSTLNIKKRLLRAFFYVLTFEKRILSPVFINKWVNVR